MPGIYAPSELELDFFYTGTFAWARADQGFRDTLAMDIRFFGFAIVFFLARALLGRALARDLGIRLAGAHEG